MGKPNVACVRPVWIMAFVLLVVPRFVHAQEDTSTTAPGEVPHQDEAPSENTDAELVDTDVPEEEEAVTADEPASVEAPPIERVESTPSSSSIEHVESTPEVQDDLPPSLREVEAPPMDRPEELSPLSPLKGYLGLGTGLGFHLNAQSEFQQNTIAPAYLHLRGGMVLPGRGRVRYAVQLGVSTNLSREGTHPSGTLALNQWLVVPSYMLRIGIDAGPLPAWVASGRLGLPIVLSPDVTLGAEVAVGAQYFARAGVGLYAELIYDLFVGGRQRDGARGTHHILALEIGVQIELESLP